MNAAKLLATALAVIALMVAAAPASADETNLLANGGFDGTVSGWAGYNATLSLTSPGAVGSGAAKVSLAGSATDYSIYPSPRPVTATVAGAEYKATAWVRSPFSGRDLCIRIREFAPSGSLVGSATVCLSTSTAWQQFSPVSWKAKGSGNQLDTYVYAWNARRGDSFQVDEIRLTSSATASTAPTNTALPAISGTARVGDTLSSSSGAWSGSTPMTYAYRWLRCDSAGAGCSTIAGATATTYTQTSSDLGSTVRVVVSATNSAGVTSATSAQTAQVAPAQTAPPPVPSPCGWGTFSSTLRIWPGACWRPFGDTSPFNKPIPANPTIWANSGGAITKLLSTGNGPGHITAGAPASSDYYRPVVYSRPTDPEYVIHCTHYSCDDLEGKRVRIPTGATPAGGTDGHLAVIDQSTGYQYDLWEASKPGGFGGTLNVGSGGVSRVIEPNATGITLDLDGDGRVGAATAPGFALTAGAIRPEELQAGVINHALFMSIPCAATSPRSVPPARLPASNLCADSTNRIPLGARLQLGMTAAEVNALPVAAWKKTILHAMRVYGAYFGDTGGPSSFGIALQSGATYTGFGVADRMVDFAKANGWALWNGHYVGYLRDGVPWNRLRVLDWNDPANR